MNLKNIINKIPFFFVFALMSIGCCNYKKNGGQVAVADTVSLIDTIISIDSTTVLKANDTIVVLSEQTANAVCKPVPTINNKKYKYICSYLNDILKNRYKQIVIADYGFDLNESDSNDSLLIYEKEYSNYLSYDVVRAIKIKHRVMTLDHGDRKMFYGIMNYFESSLGYADIYALSCQGKEINREFAHFASWKTGNFQITIADRGLANCMQEIKQRRVFYIKIIHHSHDVE